MRKCRGDGDGGSEHHDYGGAAECGDEFAADGSRRIELLDDVAGGGRSVALHVAGDDWQPAGGLTLSGNTISGSPTEWGRRLR